MSDDDQHGLRKRLESQFEGTILGDFLSTSEAKYLIALVLFSLSFIATGSIVFDLVFIDFQNPDWGKYQVIVKLIVFLMTAAYLIGGRFSMGIRLLLVTILVFFIHG